MQSPQLYLVRKVKDDAGQTDFDIHLAVTDTGSGLPLLFVHGFPFDHSMWNGLSAELLGYASSSSETSQKNAKSTKQSTPSSGNGQYRIIAPDLRGFGASPWPFLHGGVTRMEDFADDLAALLDVLGIDEKVVVCGLSMGGYIAAVFAQRHAEKLAALVLCDTKTSIDTPEVAENRRRLAEKLENGSEHLEAMATGMIPKLLFDAGPFDKQDTEAQNVYRESVRFTTQMITAQPLFAVAAAARGMAERFDTTTVIRQLEIPTLFLCGSNDLLTPPLEMWGLAHSAKRGRFAEILSSGHLAPIDNPIGFARELASFLDDLP